MRTLVFALVVSTLHLAFAQDAAYVGAENCRGCHPKAYEIWSASQHARAQTTLPEESRQTLACLLCHATDAQKSLLNYRFGNVQCEACHGPGARHVLLAAAKDPSSEKPGGLEAITEKTCLRCHTEVRSPKLRRFEYELARQTIRHW